MAVIASAVLLSVRLGELERQASLTRVAPIQPFDVSLASLVPAGEPELDFSTVNVPTPLEIRRGQTLGGLLGELGLEPREVHDAVASLGVYVDVRRIRPGEDCLAYFDRGERLANFRLSVADKGWVELAREGDGWESSWHEFERSRRLRRIEGQLDDFLEASIRRAGGEGELAYAMARVLQWDLDFNRDLRLGDRFEVLYEELRIDGRARGVGEILALVYENQGRRLEAYRYGERGYYDADGRPVRKMFRRSPLDFSRVTSRFSHRRFHPVLKVHRPHYGVDYGAPTGTPIKVTAHGVVSFAGRSGGAGNMVKVRHTNGYETLYLHLSRYAKGLHRGQRVLQGDVIGYVGSTGLSTGPHLDYRVKRNGRYIDPLSLNKDGPSAEPIPQHELARYLARRDDLRSSLATGAPPSGWSPQEGLAAESETRLAANPAGEIPATRVAR